MASRQTPGSRNTTIRSWPSCLAAKMPFFHIGKGRYVGDTARPGAFVQGGLFRQLVESARTDFDTLLLERQQQAPTR